MGLVVVEGCGMHDGSREPFQAGKGFGISRAQRQHDCIHVFGPWIETADFGVGGFDLVDFSDYTIHGNMHFDWYFRQGQKLCKPNGGSDGIGEKNWYGAGAQILSGPLDDALGVREVVGLIPCIGVFGPNYERIAL